MLKEWYLDIDGQFTYGLLDSGTELTRAPAGGQRRAMLLFWA